jgi:hypothetical protein
MLMRSEALSLPDELLARLRGKAEFQRIEEWTIRRIASQTSAHTYHFRCAHVEYFVKLIKDNERRILQVLDRLGLELAPRVIYSDLLEDDILVAEFIPGGQLQSKRLDPVLVQRYALMQNALNDESLFREGNPASGCAFSDHDDGFYRAGFMRCLEEGYEELLRLRHHRLAIVERYVRLAEHVRANRAWIADEYADMPFAWLHHDFKENNIVGHPPKLVDWGSSYGHGPFLYDLGSFVRQDAQTMATFVQHSDICRSVAPAQIRRWAYVSTCSNLAGFVLWRLKEPGGNWSTRAECQAFLEYEYAAYHDLLETPAV